MLRHIPGAPGVVKVLGPEELGKQAGYFRPHTVHCGPDGPYVSCLGGADGREGPGGVALVDHDTFEVTGSWELDRGDQYQARSRGEVAAPATGFCAVPPLVTDIKLSVDDRFLYVSCWGTGKLKQYDVTDPFHPRETGSVRIGGIASQTPHPAQPDVPLRGGPQMVEASRDGKCVYFTNSLYGALDEQFYPAGVGAWMAKPDTGTEGGISLDARFFPRWEEAFRGRRVYQVRLQGGDASSDSYCNP